MKLVAKLILIFSLIFQSRAYTLPLDCSEALLSSETGTLFGKKIQFTRVPSAFLKSEKHVLLTSKLGKPNSVFIGIMPDGHMYFVTKSYMFDGEYNYKNPRLSKVSYLRDGFVIEISDESGSLENSLHSYFKDNPAPRALSCVKAVCKIINKATTLSIDEKHVDLLMPDNFLKLVLEKGFKSFTGSKIKTSYYYLGDESLEQYQSGMQKYSRQQLTLQAISWVNISIVFLSLGTFGVVRTLGLGY